MGLILTRQAKVCNGARKLGLGELRRIQINPLAPLIALRYDSTVDWQLMHV